MMRTRMMVVVAGVVVACGGCESMQRKFTRKPKTVERPSPVVSFRNYMEGVTPLERYRKHYVLFTYWNDELIAELQQRDVSAKRAKHASEGALSELQELRALLKSDAAAQLQPMIDQWARLDQQLNSQVASGVQLKSLARTLETQTRNLNRAFDWRKVGERLNQPGDASAH